MPAATPHAPHQSPGHNGPGSSLSRTAFSATIHCLTGCAIGEVLGMVLSTWWGWSNTGNVALSVSLAFVFGYSLTMLPLLRARLTLRRSLALAFASDTLSIATMEVLDTLIIFILPGAMNAGVGDPLFWGSLAGALFVAFWAALAGEQSADLVCLEGNLRLTGHALAGFPVGVECLIGTAPTMARWAQ